ncbi:MAG: hypothetical protein QW568_05390 [Candidatus Anstonellaceae archaeon]
MKNAIYAYVDKRQNLQRGKFNHPGFSIPITETTPTSLVSRNEVVAYVSNLVAYMADNYEKYIPVKPKEFMSPSTWFSTEYDFNSPAFKNLVDDFNKNIWAKQSTSMIAAIDALEAPKQESQGLGAGTVWAGRLNKEKVKETTETGSVFIGAVRDNALDKLLQKKNQK